MPDAIIPSELLNVLRCPETKEPLRLATAAEIAKLNGKLAEGRILRHDGSTLQNALTAGLITKSGARLYEIREGFPILLIDESIDLS